MFPIHPHFTELEIQGWKKKPIATPMYSKSIIAPARVSKRIIESNGEEEFKYKTKPKTQKRNQKLTQKTSSHASIHTNKPILWSSLGNDKFVQQDSQQQHRHVIGREAQREAAHFHQTHGRERDYRMRNGEIGGNRAEMNKKR
jgi:hypothetical protein